ncbi:MAG: hypothetical protein ACREPQ_14075 [Rhodanobacter sp.]
MTARRITDQDITDAIGNAVGHAEVELSKVFADPHGNSPITENFLFQLHAAISSLLMGKPVVVEPGHPYAALDALVPAENLGKIHADAALLDPALNVSPSDHRTIQ